MGDSSEGWSSSEDEDEHNPDEYNPDEDEFNPDEYNPDEDEFNPHSSVQTLKVFYWTTGLGVALLAIFTSANAISSILWVVALFVLGVAASPASTVVSVHQFWTGGVTGGKHHTGHHCKHGKKSCKSFARACKQCFNDFPIEVQERHKVARERYTQCPTKTQGNAKVKARRAEQAIAADALVCPWVDTSDEALNDIAKEGFATIKSYLQDGPPAPAQAQKIKSYMINVFGASTGTEGSTIEEEGMRSTLTTRGYDVPMLVVPRASWRTLASGQPRVQVWWTPLDKEANILLGPPALTLYDAGASRFASKQVEKKIQLLIEAAAAELHIDVAWRRAGQGGPKGKPPYHVGFRLYVMNADGTFPNGVVRYSDGPAEE